MYSFVWVGAGWEGVGWDFGRWGWRFRKTESFSAIAVVVVFEVVVAEIYFEDDKVFLLLYNSHISSSATSTSSPLPVLCMSMSASPEAYRGHGCLCLDMEWIIN